MEETDFVLLWGSNARETHPVLFLHLLRGVRRGARLVAVDPRRTSSVAFAHRWLPVRVGTDIALANAMGRVIIEEGLVHEEFVREATEGFERYRQVVQPYTLQRAEAITGVPAELIAATAREYATAPRAMICWTLGITEHHNAVDTVTSLINLALLTGHVGRYGSGLNPLRGQNNVQGGGDMGALPNRLVGFQNVEDPEVRARFERAWDCRIPPRAGWHLTAMYDAMERGELRGLYVIGENPVRSDANATRVLRLFAELEFLVVQDIFLTATAELADVVLPAPRPGASPRARSPTASGGCSGSARPWTLRGKPGTTSGSSSSWRAASAATGTTRTRRPCGTKSGCFPPCTGA
jgi:predicted molibdopterin-dependent oxidoreductase YjgC